MNVDVSTTAVDQAVRRAAVLGSPIQHSLSPVLHGAAYQALDLQGWHYDKIECDEAGFSRLVDRMGPEWAGLSLTMPLKRVALTVADEVSPLAELLGALPAGASLAVEAPVADLAGRTVGERTRLAYAALTGLLAKANQANDQVDAR